MERGNGPGAGNVPQQAVWRKKFPPDAGLHVSQRTGVKVVPEIIRHTDNDPTLQALESYTSLPEQILAFESETFTTFVLTLETLSASMKSYAASLNPAVPDWQTQLDDIITSLGETARKAYALNRDIDARLMGDGTLGGGKSGNMAKSGNGEKEG